MKTTNISFDSCSIINLINCGQLENVLKIPNHNFYIGFSVYDEVCKVETQARILNKLIQENLITLYNGHISIDLIERLYLDYSLGDGETEALAISIENGFKICCDDKRARTMSEKEIGKINITGSIGTLKTAVEESIIICSEAFTSYFQMISEGGFLPKNVTNHFFCKSP